ncbi:hypothetical protein [Actinophytocola sp. NPDC049390]|uniref:hypothetical protein n=1 Tax=Actinophytocola sp. NPDC049390 TaxID=3363894 RepID=UPI003797D2DA
MFTPEDIADLHRAAEIVQAVADRHHTADLRAVSALCSALQELRLSERYDANPTTTRR